MVGIDRRSALAAVLLSLVVAGCGGSHGSAAQQPRTSPAGTATLAGSATSISLSESSAPSSGTPTSNPPVAASSTSGRSPSSAVSIPAYLCTDTDIAQNAADAYLGALSAGNAVQAFACVLPHTVPAAVTRSLLATSGRAAVYLPRDGVDGPSVFGYQGNGKLIDVTVTKEPDGRFWVTGVAVRSG
ncbi:MAG TPA: hypothetical protein VGX49_03790 [Jatrophihabitans sp.]|nr:hypothetical protein [Jatrophihabitans sp.]